MSVLAKAAPAPSCAVCPRNSTLWRRHCRNRVQRVLSCKQTLQYVIRLERTCCGFRHLLRFPALQNLACFQKARVLRFILPVYAIENKVCNHVKLPRWQLRCCICKRPWICHWLVASAQVPTGDSMSGCRRRVLPRCRSICLV